MERSMSSSRAALRSTGKLRTPNTAVIKMAHIVSGRRVIFMPFVRRFSMVAT
jgi:hypothetical protein